MELHAHGRIGEAHSLPAGKRITLQDAREMEPRLAQREKTEEETRELLALAGQLEGLARNVGMHAGGVLIAPGKLTDFCPLYAAQGTESTISQFDMKDVERIGLVKFDFLGSPRSPSSTGRCSRSARWEARFLAREDPARRSDAYRCSPTPTPRRYSSSNRAACAISSSARGRTASRTSSRSSRSTARPMELIPEFVERKNGKRVDTSIRAWSRS